MDNATYFHLKKKLKKQIEEKCISRSDNLVTQSGEKMYRMFYMRPALFDPEFIKDIGEVFIYRIQKEIEKNEYLHRDRDDDILKNFNFQICGLETGAVPLIMAISLAANLKGININAFSVRKEPKPYGLRNLIEGEPNNKKVLLIDDISNSTSSMRKCLNVARDQGLEFSGYTFSIIGREDGNKDPNLHLPAETKLIYLFDFNEFP